MYVVNVWLTFLMQAALAYILFKMANQEQTKISVDKEGVAIVVKTNVRSNTLRGTSELVYSSDTSEDLLSRKTPSKRSPTSSNHATSNHATDAEGLTSSEQEEAQD